MIGKTAKFLLLLLVVMMAVPTVVCHGSDGHWAVEFVHSAGHDHATIDNSGASSDSRASVSDNDSCEDLTSWKSSAALAQHVLYIPSVETVAVDLVFFASPVTQQIPSIADSSLEFTKLQI